MNVYTFDVICESQDFNHDEEFLLKEDAEFEIIHRQKNIESKDREIKILREALECVIDWHSDNIQNNKEAGYKAFSTLQHDVYIATKEALAEIDKMNKVVP